MNASKLWLLLLFFGILSCQKTREHSSGVSQNDPQVHPAIATSSPIFHPSHEPGRADKPFSDAVEVGNTFYLTGQIGLDHTTGVLVSGGIEEETRQTLENIKAVLAYHGLSMRQVVKATVLLDSISDFAAFNDIYRTYFPQRPARTTFAAEQLAKGARIEIEVIAIRDRP